MMQAILDRSTPARVFKLTAGATAAGAALYSVPAFVTCEQVAPAHFAAMLHQLAAVHQAVLWLCGGLAVMVFGVMLYSIVAFDRMSEAMRESDAKDQGTPPSRFRRRAFREVLWALVPVLIVGGLATPAIGTMGSDDVRVAAANLNPGYQCRASDTGPVRTFASSMR